MRIIRGTEALKINSPTAVTIGIFDGVHRGHKKILGELKRQVRIIKGKSCIITFEPHPLKVLMPKQAPPMVISTAHKMRLFEEDGADIAVIIRFTKRFASMAPLRFAEEVLKKRLNTKVLLAGENFVLGKGRSGDIAHLKSIGKKLGFKVRSVRPLLSGGDIISSTLIRRLIISGELLRAKRLLGREVSVLGTVVKGEARGRAIGFPTANIDPHHEAIPPSGVYIVRVKLKSKQYRGILNIGFRPTFKKARRAEEPTVEVHIFGLNRPIYRKDIEVVFLKRIRDERKFRSRGLLRLRIKKDMATAKEYFKKTDRR